MKRSTGEHLGRVTISIGVATLQKGDTPQALIERADTCLYAAKRHGRNRVLCETARHLALRMSYEDVIRVARAKIARPREWARGRTSSTYPSAFRMESRPTLPSPTPNL